MKKHEVGAIPSGIKPFVEDESLSIGLRHGIQQPHLAFMTGPNEWLPIVKGCTIALITDPSKADGIAPYLITEMSWKPGKEFIELLAIGSDSNNRRVLRLGSLYKGHHTQTQRTSENIVDTILAQDKVLNDGGSDKK